MQSKKLLLETIENARIHWIFGDQKILPVFARGKKALGDLSKKKKMDCTLAVLG